MTTTRLEAFSDGVIAIIITIMVLELHTPDSATIAGSLVVGPALIAYLLSFVIIAIMWVNHHHLLHDVRRVEPSLMWLNMNLLFWMSLIPFATAYLGKHPNAAWPVSLYAIVAGLGALSFSLLRHWVAGQHRNEAASYARHQGLRRKSLLTAAAYLGAAALSWVSVYVAYVIFAALPLFYLIPNRPAGHEPEA